MKTKLLFFVLLLIVPGCQNPAGILDDSGGSNSDTRLDNITLTVDRTGYSKDDTIHVQLENDSRSSLYLGGCSQLLIATKADTGWVEAPLWVCVWEGFAVKIPADSSYTVDYVAQHLSGTYRFVAPLSFGCRDGEPLSSAKCQSSAIIYSAEFSVNE